VRFFGVEELVLLSDLSVGDCVSVDN